MESTAQTTAERQALVDRLVEIEEEMQEALKPLLQFIKEGEAEVLELEEAVLDAERELAEARFFADANPN